MEQLIVLGLIWLSGFVMQYILYGAGILSIASMLIAIIFASVYSLVPSDQSRYTRYAVSLFLALSIFIEPLRPFMGIGILVIKDRRSYFTALPALISFGLFAEKQSRPATGCLLFLLLVSLLLNYLLCSLFEMRQQLILLRDDSREQQLIVEEKNNALRENQDASIHLATLRERNRIAREIHDNVGHILTRSILQTGAIKTINKDPDLSVLLDGLHETLNTAMNNIRESVHDLHDESIDLEASLREILAAASGFETTLQIDAGLHVPKKIKYGFIAIVKEAVNNTVKHSDGNHITIIVREHPAFYQLRIEDNGHASGYAEPDRDGIGIDNIKDRVQEMGGTVSISRESGFRYIISVMKQ